LRGAAKPQRGGRQLGIALPVVVFLLVILSMLLAAATVLAMQGSAAGALETRGARALAAARAGAEWGAWMVSDPQATLAPGPAVLPDCIATTTVTLPTPLDEFGVVVQCTRHPASGEIDEGGLKVVSYQLTATASAGDAAGAERVERRVETRLTVCKNPGGLGPRYLC
jgi:MSHA biogenesis protein MshP